MGEWTWRTAANLENKKVRAEGWDTEDGNIECPCHEGHSAAAYMETPNLLSGR